MKCPCNTECTDCVAGFQKIIDLRNAGLVIYRRTTETKDVNIITGNIDHVAKTIEDIYILHNTKDTDISSADYWPEIEHNTITCPRCKAMIEHAQNLLKKGPTISGNNVTGICDNCKMKDKPCYKCRQVVKRFVPGKPDRTDIKKGRLKYWLTKIGYLLQDINNIPDEKKRAHSDTHIDEICNDSQRSKRKPDVEQLFQPLELDLAGISQPHIDSQTKDQNKEKRPVAHFPQLEKLETPIVFKDPLTKVVPSTYALFKDDETLGERSNFNVRRIFKPENASPVRINSSQTVSNEESIVSYEQIFKDTMSGTGTQQGAKNIPQSDEIIGVKPNETKHSPNIVISEKIKERHTRRKRARSAQPLEIKQEKLLHTKSKKSELPELSTKYHSVETLKIHDITEHNFKKANRIIFPRQQSNKPTKQKSSSELINDIKNKLTIAKEKKKLKQISYERTGQQSDEKDIARKKSANAIEYQESAFYDKENARQEAKQSVKSDEKDEFRAKEEIHKTRKGSQKSLKKTDIIEENFRKSEKDTQTAFEKGSYKSKEGAQKLSQDAENAKVGNKSEKHTQKAPINTQKYGYKSEKGAEKAKKAEKDNYISEKGTKNTTKDAPQTTKYGITYDEKGAKKFTEDVQKVEEDYKSKKKARKTVKNGHENEEGVQKTPRDAQKAERGGYTPEKSGKELTKDTQIAVKKAHKFEKDAQKTLTDAQKAKNDAGRTSLTEQKHNKKAELRGQKTTKDFLNSLRDAEKEEKNGYKSEKVSEKTPKDAQKVKKDAHENEKGNKKTPRDAQKIGKGTHEKSGKEPTKDTQIAVKNTHKFENGEVNAKKVTMEATDLELKPQTLSKKTQTVLSELKKNNEHELKLMAEKAKADAFKKKLDDDTKLDTKLGAKSIAPDLFDTKSIKLKEPNADDLILKLVQTKQSRLEGDRVRKIPKAPIIDMRLSGKKVPQHHILVYPPQSETCLLWSDDSGIDELMKEPQLTDVIIGPQICTIRPLKLHDDLEVMTPLLKSGYDSSRTDKKQEIAQTPDEPLSEESIKPQENEKREVGVNTETPRTKEAMKSRPQSLSPGSGATGSNAKGFVRYTLSDRKFIDNGWTLLPTEKVVRKMNVYRMRPAHPEFDWFEHNKNKRLMQYDTGEKLAEFDDNGRGRWYYRNGRMALDYYNAEELNAGQRFVIYSNGEPDERGRSRPYTLLATFDFSGNGIVFDHRGKIRLKYNQTEGVVLDRSIGPVSHWKWHTLNDPPVLQQVMLDTQIAHKDPKIMKMGGPNDNRPRKDNEEMLAIEFDNFIKEKSKKLSQTFKPFQIKMKALKINEHFSLRVLDQATVYLLYRDGTTNLKLNIGMVLNQKEIVDTDTAEVGEVSSSMEKLPARTESLAGLQRSVAHAQHYDWKRTERERKMHPAEPNASVDKLVAGISHPLRPPMRPVLSPSTSLTTENCKSSRKPTSTSVYYDTRFF